MEQAIETWRDVAGYEGVYRVSDLGRVRSLDRMVDHPKGQMRLNGKVMRLRLSHGYEKVDLCQNGLRKKFFVHRLVVTAFLGQCPDGKEVNHVDGNKLNNRPSNLEYVTHLENMQHAYQTGLSKTQIGVENINSKLTETDVLEIRAAYAAGGVAQQKLAGKYCVSQNIICNIVRRKIWAHLPPA